MSSCTAANARRLAAPGAMIIAINAIAALYDVLTYDALRHATTHPFVFAFLRDSAATVLLFLVAWWRERRKPAAERRLFPRPEDTLTFCALGLLYIYSAQGLTAMALSVSSPAFVSMFAPATPTATLLLSLVLGLEPFRASEWTSWVKVGGITVAVSGSIAVATVAFTGSSDISTASPNLSLGIGCLIAAKLVCAPVGTILQKHVL